jgi:hypothetical protein
MNIDHYKMNVMEEKYNAYPGPLWERDDGSCSFCLVNMQSDGLFSLFERRACEMGFRRAISTMFISSIQSGHEDGNETGIQILRKCKEDSNTKRDERQSADRVDGQQFGIRRL